jgi:citrate synthase
MSDALHPGLEEITVVESQLSQVDGETGNLIIRGVPIEQLAANAS